MTDEFYKEVIMILKKKRKEATASVEAANRFIDEVGIRHLLIDGDGVDETKRTPKRKVTKKK
ncbi:hypothetical protein [Chitinophaga vietnamensis]|uniref:hypothetical protein n=1 Tax=Chitinophaga vietnamensis TaxID=2593957 RepID=UPI0011786E77|nr:hypothetical protein [Chitinophaga vietnamensis]